MRKLFLLSLIIFYACGPHPTQAKRWLSKYNHKKGDKLYFKLDSSQSMLMDIKLKGESCGCNDSAVIYTVLNTQYQQSEVDASLFY